MVFGKLNERQMAMELNVRGLRQRNRTSSNASKHLRHRALHTRMNIRKSRLLSKRSAAMSRGFCMESFRTYCMRIALENWRLAMNNDEWPAEGVSDSRLEQATRVVRVSNPSRPERYGRAPRMIRSGKCWAIIALH